MTPMESAVNLWKTKGVKKSDIEETIRRIQAKRNSVDPGTPEFRQLSEDLEQELKNKKLYKEANSFGIKPDTVLIILTVLAVAGFGFALDLDSPKALKIASFILKLPGLKI